MNDFQLKTALLFLIYNRPDTTYKVFNAIRKVKPVKLYIAADGPRVNKQDEAEKCKAVRKIIEQVDWDCKVKTLFRDKNLGCRVGVSSAIDWFFENEEEGIILEDDCLPSHSFFWFCEELLERYRDDMRIGLISGFNVENFSLDVEISYFFSKYPHIWGWASWQRFWNDYNVDLYGWENALNLNDMKVSFDKKEAEFWKKLFHRIESREIDTWDAQVTFCCFRKKYLSVIPSVNLVSNIGCDIDATHTKDSENQFANTQCYEIDKPLIHPVAIIANKIKDRDRWHKEHQPKLFSKIMLKLISIYRMLKYE